MSKWLFCEGKLKIVDLEVWSVVFETLERGVFCEGVWRLFRKVVGCRFGCSIEVVPPVVVPPPPPMGFRPHTTSPNSGGLPKKHPQTFSTQGLPAPLWTLRNESS